MAKANIYETILENIDDEKTPWCRGTWDNQKGDKISRCLVSHVDLATGVSYLKPQGGRFVSKSPKKWLRRNRILRHLACEIPTTQLTNDLESARNQMSEDRDNHNVDYFIGQEYHRGGARVGTTASDLLVSWNDRSNRTKRQVKALLNRAAKNYAKD